jgi:hypothetical protein
VSLSRIVANTLSLTDSSVAHKINFSLTLNDGLGFSDGATEFANSIIEEKPVSIVTDVMKLTTSASARIRTTGKRKGNTYTISLNSQMRTWGSGF